MRLVILQIIIFDYGRFEYFHKECNEKGIKSFQLFVYILQQFK